MAGFYKIVIRGSALGQDLNNILYYSTVAPDALVFDATVAYDLGEAALVAWQAEICDLLPDVYTAEGADISLVNEDGIVTSPFTVTLSDPVSGALPDFVGGVASVLIAKFNCTSAPIIGGAPVPKRSYLAIGPLPESQVDTNGALVNQAAWQPKVEAAVTQGHLIGAVQFLPYRVGRVSPAAPAGVGAVNSVVVRPFTSFRRSRMLSPTGK